MGDKENFMLQKLALFLKKYPFLHKILSFIYRNFVVKIVSGYYWRCVKYFLCTYFPEKTRLKKYGLRSIKPIKIDEWRWGKGLDKAYRRYYIANYKEKTCFVKVAKNDATIVNEIRINTYLKLFLGEIDFTAKLIRCNENFCTDTAMMAIEFVNDLEKFYIPQDIKEFENICISFTKILKSLEKTGIIHADIHKGNLMLKEGKLVLLDFGISKMRNKENGIDYKARPGTFFRIEGSERIYNDAYSFIKMLEQMGVNEEYKNLEVYKSIVKMCDANSFTVMLK